jgi:hypothetical protein
VLRGAALDRIDDDLLGADGGGLARFGLEPLHQVGGIPPHVSLELLQQHLAGLFGAEPGDPLQLSLPLGHQLLGARGVGRGRGFAAGDLALPRAEVLFEPIGGGEPVGQRAGLVGERLLERQDLLTPVPQLVLRLGGDLLRLFTRLDDGFLAKALGVAFRLLQHGLRADLRLFEQALDIGPGVERGLLLRIGAGLGGFRARARVDHYGNDDQPSREHGQNRGR